jgi:LysR family transcriptional regulator, mexEF-oprN operon transcriptional activator
MPRDVPISLLLVFEAIATERNVTRAAARLNMSQSAVSHALKRLRTVLGDPLFVRSRHGVQPTARALALNEKIAPLLIQLRTALAPVEFDPATQEHTFRIIMSDYSAAVLFDPLVAALTALGPGIKIDLMIRPLRAASKLVTNGDADCMFAPVMPPQELRGLEVLDDGPPTVLFAQGHPLSTGSMTLERYVAARHAYVPFDGLGQSSGLLDEELARRGLKREIALKVPHLALVPRVLAQTDLIMITTKRLADRYSRQYGLVCRALPIVLSPMPIRLIWHPLLATHAADEWFRRYVLDLCSTLADQCEPACSQ